MSKIKAYLTFSGNCREAMTYYQACLGGDLEFQTIGESPMAERMPAEMKDFILHATLKHQALELMGSDMVGEQGLMKGNNVSLMLDCDSEKEIKAVYKYLSKGGEATHPLEITFWGALFGDLKDKFGNQWLLHFDKQETTKNKTNQKS
jgi:PhnB protein